MATAAAFVVGPHDRHNRGDGPLVAVTSPILLSLCRTSPGRATDDDGRGTGDRCQEMRPPYTFY